MVEQDPHVTPSAARASARFTPVEAGATSGEMCDLASGLLGKPYKLIQYGFNPVIPDRCRDPRRNLNDPVSLFARKFYQFWDRKRKC